MKPITYDNKRNKTNNVLMGAFKPTHALMYAVLFKHIVYSINSII